ncbi:hypothetical protein BJH93_06935 [Kocuria polaris]|nr:hypothetical protein [Kocuria polaris]
MDLDDLLRQRGALTRRDLADRGLSRRRIEAAFSNYPRPRADIIADPGLHPNAMEALRLAAALTCVSAAEFTGGWVLTTPSGLHLAAPHGHPLGPCRFAVVRHRSTIAATLVVDPTQMCLHAAGCLEPVESAVIVESALVRGLVTLDDLHARLGNRHGRIARQCLALVRGVADSPIEVVVRAGLLAARLDFREQVELPGIGRVDFLVAGRLIVELDGWQWHGNRTAWQHDMRRDQEAARSGYRTIRFSASQVLNGADSVIETIREILATGTDVRIPPFSRGDDLNTVC